MLLILLHQQGGHLLSSVFHQWMHWRDFWRAIGHFCRTFCLRLKSISHKFLPRESLLYLDFMGILPSLLEEKFVSFLVSQFGSLISWDFNFTKPERMDVISCLASVPNHITSCNFDVIVNSVAINIKMSLRQSIAWANCDLSIPKSSESDSISNMEWKRTMWKNYQI